MNIQNYQYKNKELPFVTRHTFDIDTVQKEYKIIKESHIKNVIKAIALSILATGFTFTSGIIFNFTLISAVPVGIIGLITVIYCLSKTKQKCIYFIEDKNSVGLKGKIVDYKGRVLEEGYFDQCYQLEGQGKRVKHYLSLSNGKLSKMVERGEFRKGDLVEGRRECDEFIEDGKYQYFNEKKFLINGERKDWRGHVKGEFLYMSQFHHTFLFKGTKISHHRPFYGATLRGTFLLGIGKYDLYQEFLKQGTVEWQGNVYTTAIHSLQGFPSEFYNIPEGEFGVPERSFFTDKDRPDKTLFQLTGYGITTNIEKQVLTIGRFEHGVYQEGIEVSRS